MTSLERTPLNRQSPSYVSLTPFINLDSEPWPYEFGVKVSVATTLHRSKRGQFIAHVKALPGNPYDCLLYTSPSPRDS